MQSKEKAHCFVENCKNPLWKNNPLFALLCGHKICRECCLDITKNQVERIGLISIDCSECKV